MQASNIAQLLHDLHVEDSPVTLVINHTNLGEFQARVVDEEGVTILDRTGDRYLFALGNSIQQAVDRLNEICS
jgi:hypothetical protein